MKPDHPWIVQYFEREDLFRRERIERTIARVVYPTGWGGWPGAPGSALRDWLNTWMKAMNEQPWRHGL